MFRRGVRVFDDGRVRLWAIYLSGRQSVLDKNRGALGQTATRGLESLFPSLIGLVLFENRNYKYCTSLHGNILKQVSKQARIGTVRRPRYYRGFDPLLTPRPVLVI